MPEKRELPAELKAVEAELAALVPRTDEIDREHLIFLAGQASAEKAALLRRRPLGWPAATATMTAAAASLLALLIMQPDPVVETRIVYRDRPVAAPEDGQPAHDDEPAISPFQEPEPANDSTLARALAWIAFPDRHRLRMESPHFSQLDRMLDRQAAGSPEPLFESPFRRPRHDTERASAPVTYEKLLDSVIDIPKPDVRTPDSSATEILSPSGVNS